MPTQPKHSCASRSAARPLVLRGEALAKAYAELKSVELKGKVWATYEGRRIVIRGEGLPVHPQHPQRSMKTWSLFARKTPTHCRQYLENRGCMGQSVPYDPIAG